jgi:DNA-directed RNA polymerase subunit M/transcription elongation factor TFIIS
MYYLKIQDEDGNIGNTLIYYCRNCGHEDTTLSTNNICVSDMQLLSSEKKYTHIVNEYTKFDPTLPRINTIKCPNQDCVSNGGVQGGGGGKRKTEEEKQAAAESKKAATEEKKKEKEAIKAATAIAKKSASQAKKSAAEAQATLAVVKANLETLSEEEEQEAEQQKAQEQHTEQHNNREVIYIRYDDTNMKYVYLCAHCDTTWRTDNRL